VERGERVSVLTTIGQASSYIALAFGILFFTFATKYYLAILLALFGGRNNSRKMAASGKGREAASGDNPTGGNEEPGNDELRGLFRDLKRQPFVSIQLPFYNEVNVARRIIGACLEIDYLNYEVIVADDSRDETVDILREFSRRRGPPAVKFVHRKDRSGFKGGALQQAVGLMDPRTEYVVVLDADFIPPPDIIKRFLWYFESQDGRDAPEGGEGHRFADRILNHYGNGGNGDDIYERVESWYEMRRIGVVQGYQYHHLNKEENWITKGVRAEYSGGYMIERVAQEYFGSMKMITGSVFMIRAEILRKLGWTHSITEDWDLTLRMYMEGYKVLYTPLISAPAEIPTTIRALARQRMRWAEGHTYAVKKHFWGVMRSKNITLREKAEFAYYAPYYLQSLFFLVGSLFWMLAETIGEHPWFWSATFGWCLLLSNLFALPLMGLTGLFLEETAMEDFSGVFSFIVLSYVLTPFQAYAAVKGLLERDEGGWVRTYKTGSITDRILQVRVRKLFDWILPRRERTRRPSRTERDNRRKPSVTALILLVLMSTFIVWMTGAAVSKPSDGELSTSISFEFDGGGVIANTHPTQRILTHPDYTDLNGDAHMDVHAAGLDWGKAWSFYLHGPLTEKYKMKGEATYNLYLRADDETKVDIKIVLLEVDERGRTKEKADLVFEDVTLDDSGEPLVLRGEENPRMFRQGSTILLEIWLRAAAGGEKTIYFDYDSHGAHSRIDFPGIVMPEGLLPLLLMAPLIPTAALGLRRIREGRLRGDDEN
jgi:cellulose synthase/poly-beta-1,6-N-acetylglucosamine synthase-like glycosyltransferase